jgi:transposase-like protein
MQQFSITQFTSLFPTENACLDEIKKLRYPHGIYCPYCSQKTKHYKLDGRAAYSCEYCRHQVFPLKGTIFEKSTTPLRIWFFCMLLMTYTRGKISAKNLQKELHVTYKTAWRMRKQIFKLMKQNHADLLAEPEKTISVSFFNAFEFKVVHKQEHSV